jgi:hypothetical protein
VNRSLRNLSGSNLTTKTKEVRQNSLELERQKCVYRKEKPKLISDVLFDAVQKIEWYEQTLPDAYSDFADEIAEAKSIMRRLQLLLDALPLVSESVCRNCGTAVPPVLADIAGLGHLWLSRKPLSRIEGIDSRNYGTLCDQLSRAQLLRSERLHNFLVYLKAHQSFAQKLEHGMS